MQSQIERYNVDRGSVLINKTGVAKKKKKIQTKATKFPFLTRKYKK